MLRQRTCRIIIDVIIAVLLTALVFYAAAAARPVRRGFFCDDESIRYPYRRDTVRTWMLFSFVLFVTIFTFLAVELGQRCRVGLSSTWRSAVWASLRLFGIYWFGLMITFIITETGKLGVGRLRPHFIDVCKPDLTDCIAGRYVEDYSCSNSSHPALLYQMRKSFPSGHASISVYLACFLAYYLGIRLQTSYSALIRPLLQTGLCALAIFTCVSRVTDNMHHSTDVIAGAIVGIVCCAATVLYFKKTFELLDESQSERSPPHDELSAIQINGDEKTPVAVLPISNV